MAGVGGVRGGGSHVLKNAVPAEICPPRAAQPATMDARAVDTISHPDKVLFPQDGITKGDLAAYYDAVAPLMLPHLRGRPVTMERFPSGIGHKGFLQKDV